MTRVLIPYTELIEESDYILTKIFDIMYESDDSATYTVYFEYKTFMQINVTDNLGKGFPMKLAKALGMEYCYFIKSNIMYKKWLDTGIVDKLGVVEESKPRYYKLIGV